MLRVNVRAFDRMSNAARSPRDESVRPADKMRALPESNIDERYVWN